MLFFTFQEISISYGKALRPWPLRAGLVRPLCLLTMESSPDLIRIKARRLTLLLLLIWAGITVLPLLLARHPSWQIAGWPLDFWVAAQGSILVYLALVVFYAWQVNRWERESGTSAIEIPQGPPN